MSRPGSDDRGSVAVETAVVAPALIVLLLLVVFAGRVSQAEAAVQRAASEASRAASLEFDTASATEVAEATVAANLASSQVVCADLETDIDVHDLVPGGRVSVTVRCVAPMSDLALLGVPGQRTMSATSIEVVDRYRADGVEG